MADSCDLLCINLELAESIRREQAELPDLAPVAETFAALSDPTRLLLLQALAHAEMCGCDLAWILERSQSLISHHLRALRAAGLVESRREGKMVIYSLTAHGAEFGRHTERMSVS